MADKGATSKNNFLNIHGMTIFLIVGTLVLSAIGVFCLFSHLPAEMGSRTVHPPGKPTSPTPPNDQTGIIGETIELNWDPSENYRGDHKTITDTWLKVSTQGPCNSDGATANIFNGAIGPSNSYRLSGSSVKMSTTYYWAVKNEDEDGWGTYSNWKFSTNSLPVASITSITPSQAREGQEVMFVGEGVDNADNDEITAYRWTSSVDEELSDKKSFSSLELDTPLTPGIHQITFEVMDENDLWSEITSQCKRNLEITVNTPPSKPSALEVDGDSTTDDGELTTHKLSPRIKWKASSDPDPEDSIKYYISISTQRTYERSVADDVEISVPEYSVPGVLSYGTLDSYTNIMSNTYYIELYASDGFKNSEKVMSEFKVVNNPPGEPTIEIDPSSPQSDESFLCKIISNSEDPDNDNIQYTYKWYNNDKYQEKLSGRGPEYAQIPKTETEHFETWRVEVIPNDGFIDGESTEEEIIIENVPPIPKISNPLKITAPKYLESTYYTIEEIPFDASDSSDPDNDNIVDYRWTSNISGLIGNGESLKKILDRPGEHLITLQVTDQHGAVNNATTIIWVEEPPKPILIPEFSVDDVGPFYVGDKVDSISVVIHNRGTDKALDLIIRITNNGKNEAQLPFKKGVSIAQNTTYFLPVDPYKIGTDLVKLEVVIQGNNSYGLPLSKERNELNYSKNAWSPTVRPAKEKSVSESRGGWLKDNWFWIGLGLLVVFVIIAALVFILVKYSGSDEEEEYSSTPDSPDRKTADGYSIDQPPGSRPGAYPPQGPFPPAGPFPGSFPGAGQFPGGGPFLGAGMFPGQSQMLLPPGMGAGTYRGRHAGAYVPPQRLALPLGPEGAESPSPPGFPPRPPFPMSPGSLPGIPGFQGGPPSMQGPQFPSPFPSSPFGMQAPMPPSHFGAPDRQRGTDIFSEPSSPRGNEGEIEVESAEPTCDNCGGTVQEGWLMCPQCKKRLR